MPEELADNAQYRSFITRPFAQFSSRLCATADTPSFPQQVAWRDTGRRQRRHTPQRQHGEYDMNATSIRADTGT